MSIRNNTSEDMYDVVLSNPTAQSDVVYDVINSGTSASKEVDLVLLDNGEPKPLTWDVTYQDAQAQTRTMQIQ